MDVNIVIILLAEAAFCIMLLHFEGLLKKPAHVVAAAALTVAAFGLRYAFLSHETLDYTTFLAKWVQFFRDNGGFSALSHSVGNYNVPYLYFLSAFSYSDVNDLYLIKLLSVFFDVVLAWASMRLAGRFTKSVWRRLTAFFVVMLWPSVVLNGAYWGQCDSIYAAFAVLSVYFALDKKPAFSMICIAVSFAFKLQAVFIMPLFLVLLFCL
ncbi:MAG: conjugal transfer protein TraL, partial [Clostridia bacterium]|nr:conjugal transfer protein TraL [Clostridia bacterium]